MRGGISLGARDAVLFALATVGTLALAIGTAFGGVLPGADIVVAENNTFVDPERSMEEGAIFLFQSNDDNTHNVTAHDTGPDGKPLFRSGNVNGPASDRPVNGTQFLSVGTYDFECTIHPGTMQGTLTVMDFPAGPLPRPAIDVAIKSKKLAKVVKKKKLKVEVSASQPTDADGVSLQASKGRKSITKTLEFDLAAGATETEKLKLKKSAAKKLADLEKAKVKVTGTVDFGSPANASKKLK